MNGDLTAMTIIGKGAFFTRHFLSTGKFPLFVVWSVVRRNDPIHALLDKDRLYGAPAGHTFF